MIQNKIYLLFLLIIPFLFLWNVLIKKRGKRHITYSSRYLLPVTKDSFKIFLLKNLFYLRLFSLFLFIVALSNPQDLNSFNIEKKKGVDILIALDISGSMASVDFKPENRLEVAKKVIAEFIKKRKSDRIGLVIFAGASLTRCPLTTDFGILAYFLKETAIGDIKDGTAIGMALATSVNRIRNAKSKSKIIILLTDGVNNTGEIDPGDAADMAGDFGIKVYTIGVGTKGQAPYPVIDPYGKKRFVMVNVQIDDKLLQKIANKTGGIYFRATDKFSLKQIFSEIDRWEKTETSVKKFTEAKDLYPYFLIGGFLLLIFAEFAKRSFLRTLP